MRQSRHSFQGSRAWYGGQVERADREAQKAAAYEKQQTELAHLQSFVDKWGAGTKSAAAQSRVKQMEKIKANAIEAPEGLQAHRANLQFPKPPACHFEQVRKNLDARKRSTTEIAHVLPRRVRCLVGGVRSLRSTGLSVLNQAPSASLGGVQLFMTEGAFGWGDAPIVTGATFLIEKEMRVVVRGPNGAGKSTMLRAMANELPLKSGTRR
jgi:ATPase subunit of ABC transporter with duplicated ATPase domains